MKKKLLILSLITFLTITAEFLHAEPKINMVGDWSGSPDCVVSFYQDDGSTIDGNCDNGNFNHVISGRYSRNDENKIDITITRDDVRQKCKTSVKGYLKILDNNTIKMWQQGWDGCGVDTPSGSQVWQRK
jgi:hypothetical protein